MATKDWKKTGIGKWQEKISGDKNLNIITKYGNPPHPPRVIKIIVPYAFMTQQVFVVEVEYLNGRGIDRSPDFKKKSQALKFARAYMRKH